MRRTALAAAGAALAIALAGCGGTTAGNAVPLFDDAQKLVRAASSETSKAKTAKLTIAMTLGPVSITAHGAGRFAGADSAMSMTMDVMGKSAEMRIVDKTLYMKAPDGRFASPIPGKPWVKITPSSGGMFSNSLSNIGKRGDPTEILQQIEKAGTITKSEQTEMNGQPVTHYWLELEFAKIAKHYAGQLPQRVLGMVRGEMGDVKLPMQLWLNSEQLPVKVTSDMSAMLHSMVEAMQGELPPGASPGVLKQLKNMQMSMTMTYSDWGAPVKITAPPADKVTTPK